LPTFCVALQERNLALYCFCFASSSNAGSGTSAAIQNHVTFSGIPPFVYFVYLCLAMLTFV
jgi:hypothetical protein